MDKWLTLDQAAKRLNLHEHDLLDLAIDGKIIFHWLPNGLDQMGVDIVQVELTTITGLDDEKYEGWKPVKDSKLIKHNFGPFLIDITIDDRWSLILDAIKNKFNVDNYFGDDDNLRFKYLEHIYKAYFDNPLTVYLPKLSELNVLQTELERYEEQFVIELSSISRELLLPRQQEAIINALKALGIPLDKVPQKIKKGVRRSLIKSFHSEKAFDNTWQSLINCGIIKTHGNLSATKYLSATK